MAWLCIIMYLKDRITLAIGEDETKFPISYTDLRTFNQLTLYPL